jgi:hypothetical protein
MVALFTLLLHLTLLLAAVGQLFLIATIINALSPRESEKFMRGLSAAAGFLIYVGAKAIGISIPDLLFRGLAISYPITIGLLGILFPAIIGYVLAWYVTRHLNSTDAMKNVLAMRALTMIVTLVFFLYCDAYLATYGDRNEKDVVLLLPNLTFVLSVLLYTVFKYHPPEDAIPLWRPRWRQPSWWREPVIPTSEIAQPPLQEGRRTNDSSPNTEGTGFESGSSEGPNR